MAKFEVIVQFERPEAEVDTGELTQALRPVVQGVLGEEQEFSIVASVVQGDVLPREGADE